MCGARVWLILFIIGTIVMAVLFISKMLGPDTMPFSCPRCSFGGDDNIAGQIRPWYATHRTRVRCRSCRTYFKEHPNGQLVEDRDF
jgi:hypothetical protein